MKLKHIIATLILLISTGVNAAYIDTINGPQSAFHIERDGKKLKKIAPFQPLKSGDKITVRKPTHEFEQIRDKENSISLALDEGKFKTLKYAETQEKPYIITAATHYQIIITDAQGDKVIAEFTAVTDAPLPYSEAQAIEQSNLPAQSKKTLLAIGKTRRMVF